MRRGASIGTGRAACVAAACALALLTLALPGAAPARPAPACAGASTPVIDAKTARHARGSVLCLVNRERAARGVPAVRAAPALALAARRHSHDMLRRRYFAHVSPDGQGMTDRVRRTRYARGAGPRDLGETLVTGEADMATPAQLVRVLLGSPTHRDVILDPEFRDIGAGLARGMPPGGPGGSGATLTLLFGRR